jgi:hypothetical protein
MTGSKLAAVAAALAMLLAARAPSASELRWEGADCPDRGQLLFELERALGKPLPSAGELTFHVVVESSEGRVRARMRVESSAAAAAVSERVLAAASCAELTETLAVAISLAIGRSQSDTEPSLAVAVQPEARGGAMPAAGVGEVGPEGRSAAERSGPRASAVALLVADVGSLPHAALGAGLAVELGWARIRVQLGAAMFYPQRARWSGGSDVGANLALTLATARACTPGLGSGSQPFAIPLCLGMEAGQMEGDGYGVTGARSREILWIAPRAEAGLSWTPPGTPMRLETNLGVVMPLNRDRFIFDGMGTLHQPSRIAGRLAASLNFAFE